MVLCDGKMLMQHLMTILQSIYGICLGIGSLSLDIVTFISCFIISSAFAIGTGSLMHFIWNVEFPPFVISYFHGLFVICFGRIHGLYKSVVLGRQMSRLARKYPIGVGLLPRIGTLVLCLLSILQIQVQFTNYSNSFAQIHDGPHFEASEGIGPKPSKNTVIPKTIGLLASEKHGDSICWFIFVFSYLIHAVSLLLMKITNEQLSALHLVNRREREFPCIVTGFFVACQIGTTVGYSLPLFYSFIILGFLDLTKSVLFFYVCGIAAAIGFLGSFLETREPFPMTKGIPPFFAFESNVQARIIFLKFGLLPFVYMYFFERLSQKQEHQFSEPSAKAQQTRIDPHFLIFTTVFSILLLHTVKIISISTFVQHAIDQRRIRQQREQFEQAAQRPDQIDDGREQLIRAIDALERHPHTPILHRENMHQIVPNVPLIESTLESNNNVATSCIHIEIPSVQTEQDSMDSSSSSCNNSIEESIDTALTNVHVKPDESVPKPSDPSNNNTFGNSD